MWSYTSKVNELSGKYQMDITKLDKETVKALKAAGLNVKKGEGDKASWGFYLTAKSARPVSVVDAAKQPYTKEFVPNGSEVKCSVKPYEYDFKGKKGVGAGLQAVMVLKEGASAGGLDELEAEDALEQAANDFLAEDNFP